MKRERTLNTRLEDLNQLDTFNIWDKGLNGLNKLRELIRNTINIVPGSKLDELVNKLPNGKRVKDHRLGGITDAIENGNEIIDKETVEGLRKMIREIPNASGQGLMAGSILSVTSYTIVDGGMKMINPNKKIDIDATSVLGLSAVLLGSGMASKAHKMWQANRAEKSLNQFAEIRGIIEPKNHKWLKSVNNLRSNATNWISNKVNK